MQARSSHISHNNNAIGNQVLVFIKPVYSYLNRTFDEEMPCFQHLHYCLLP